VRTRKTVGGHTTQYVLDLATLPVVISDTDAVYLYGLDIIAQQQAERLYYFQDGLESVRQLLDSTGQVETNYAYDPFGVPVMGGDGSNPYQFTGEAWDAEVELLYLRARYYQPEVGRFLSRDPREGTRWLPASLHPYGYTHNNPTNLVDPGGLTAQPPAKPHIVSRSEWGAVDPGVYVVEVRYPKAPCAIPITTGRHEGMFDPMNPQATAGGYARYEDLWAACKSGRLIDPACDRLPPGDTFDLALILDTIVIHHEGNVQTYDVQEVQRQHMIYEGYSDIGYHYMVGPSGSIYEGRSVEVRGAHVTGKNTSMIGVLELGDFQPGMVLKGGREFPWDWDDDPGPTAEQFASTVTLIRWLDYLYGIDRVVGHRDVPEQNTLCPGKNFTQSQIDELNAVAQER
jgi:RHS repeat-associated protein